MRVPGKAGKGKKAKDKGKVHTEVSIYAHLGTRVPIGTAFGKLSWKVEHER